LGWQVVIVRTAPVASPFRSHCISTATALEGVSLPGSTKV
jgi:hypothetical protein